MKARVKSWEEMQAEIDKRDALAQECLDQESQSYGMRECDAIHFRMRKIFSILKYDYKELTQEKDEKK